MPQTGAPKGENAMRMLCLIRHGEVTGGAHRCISRTDLPLSPQGRRQAEALSRFLRDHPVSAVFSSPSSRCMETAALLEGAPAAVPCEALREVDVGQWENLTFEEIRARFPEDYRARGAHIGTAAPPGGESFLAAGRRLDACLRELLSSTQGDLAIVSHGGVIRGFLCLALGLSPDEVFSLRQPRGGMSTVAFDGEAFRVLSVGCKPESFPGDEEIRQLLARCATPEPVIAHSRAVAKKALSLAACAPEPVDWAMLRAACLLHDLCRAQGRGHAEKAASLLDAQGYPELARVVSQHHDLHPGAGVEAELLYLADKLTRGCEDVPLEARFEASRAKCASPEAQAAWSRRYADARRLAQKYQMKED